MNDYEREEQKQRAQAWYAILGLGALVAGAVVILSRMPDNPFRSPSDIPNTTRLNSTELSGAAAPMVAVSPSAQQNIGPGCRVADVALVQEWRDPLRRTVTEHLLDLDDGARGSFVPEGWTATAPEGDAGTVACAVHFAWRDARRAHRATWWVSEDHRTVTPANDEARALLAPRGRSRRGGR